MGWMTDALRAAGGLTDVKAVKAELPRVTSRLIGIGNFQPPSPTTAAALDLVATSPWVGSILGRIADMTAGANWYLADKNDKRIFAHPILDFINAGSEIFSGFESLKLAQQQMDAAGECFWLFGRGINGQPASYIPVPAHWVHEVPRPDADFYEIHSPHGGSIFKLPASEMIWFRNPNPRDPFSRGISITKSLMTDVALEREMAGFMYAFVKNRARPEFIITGTEENPMSEEDVRAFESMFLDKFGGKGNGRPMVSNSPLNIKELTSKLRESEMVEQRKLARDFLSEVFGVPPEIFGRVENSNRATAEAADYMMARYVIEPRLRQRQATLQAWGRKEWSDLRRLTLKFESVVSEDKAHVLNTMRGLPSAFRRDEVRASAGLPPVGGEEGDEWMATVTPGAQKDGDPKEIEDGNDASSSNAPNKGPKAGKKMLAAPIEKALSDEQIESIAEAHEGNREHDLAILLPVLLALIRDRAGDAGVIESELEAWVIENGGELLDQINGTTRDAVAAAIGESESKQAIGAAIMALFAGWVATRAMMIAVTQANDVANAAIELRGRATGDNSKIWLTRADERVRATHQALNGVIVPVAEMFTSPSGDRAHHPGGFSTAAENVNCRCACHTFRGDAPAAGDRINILASHDAWINHNAPTIAVAIKEIFAAQMAVILAALSELKS